MDLHVTWNEWKVTWYAAWIEFNGDATDETLSRAKKQLVEQLHRLKADLLLKDLRIDEAQLRWSYYPGSGIGWKVPVTHWEDLPCQNG